MSDNYLFMSDFLSTSGVRRDARYLVREIAGYSGVDLTTLVDDAQCKDWADKASQDSLQTGLNGFCQFLAHELSKIQSCESQRQRNRSIAATFSRTFPSLRSVTIKHDSSRKDAYPIRDGSEDTTVSASLYGTHVQVAWTFKATGETVLSPEKDAADAAAAAPQVGSDLPSPSDTRYTHAAVAAALASLQDQLAEALGALAEVSEAGRIAIETLTAPQRSAAGRTAAKSKAA